MIAPIALFIYKRPRHTARTLASLAANVGAAQSELVIFSDGPKGTHDISAVAETRAIAQGAKGFASVRLAAREHNNGLANSVIAGVNELMASHGRAIVVEDDLVTMPHFLSYMNKALEHYRDDSKVFSVTGYTFPSARLIIPPDYPYDTYPAYRCSSWGWGCWADRWRTIDWSMDYFSAFMRDKTAREKFNRGGPDLTSMLRLQQRGQIDSWAIRFAYAHYKADMRCIHTVKSMVQNIGLDNSGTHTGESAAHTHDRLDMSWEPTRFCSGAVMDARITEGFYRAATPPHVSFPRRVMRKLLKVASLR